MGQGEDALPFFGRGQVRSQPGLTGIVALQMLDFGEFGVPVVLDAAGDEAIFRIDGAEAASSEIGFVAGACFREHEGNLIESLQRQCQGAD